jgi:hypothetical protein
MAVKKIAAEKIVQVKGIKPLKNNVIDFEADAKRPAKAGDLAVISSLAEEMRGIESWIQQNQMAIDAKMERYRQIQDQELPDAMTSAGMKDFTLSSGEKVSIKDVVRGSIPSNTAIEKAEGAERAALEARKAAALAWLKKNGAEALVKTELSASFGKGQSKDAQKIRQMIIKAGFPATLDDTVNFQTLNKFLRESIERGTDVPAETFSLFTGKQAQIEKARQKRSS